MRLFNIMKIILLKTNLKASLVGVIYYNQCHIPDHSEGGEHLYFFGHHGLLPLFCDLHDLHDLHGFYGCYLYFVLKLLHYYED